MKKLSEILKLAMPTYEQMIAHRQSRGEDTGTVPGFCYAVAKAENVGDITLKEAALFSDAIYNRIPSHVYLASYLKSKKKGSSAAHRLAYYKRWIEQLEKKGL